MTWAAYLHYMFVPKHLNKVEFGRVKDDRFFPFSDEIRGASGRDRSRLRFCPLRKSGPLEQPGEAAFDRVIGDAVSELA